MGTWSDGLTSPVSPRGQRQAYEDESNTDWMLMLEYPDQPWREQAACRGSDPELFFAERGANLPHEPNEAKAICATCPAKAPCLEYALQRPERYGIWGGTAHKERLRIRRQRKAKEAA